MMTSRFAKCAVAVGAIGLAGVLPSSTQAANTTATATATVAVAIAIVKNVDMQFGTIAGGGAAGTVILATDGSRGVTGGTTTLASGPGAAGDFTVSGQAAATYSITLPADGVVLLAGIGPDMGANTFISLPAVTGLLDGLGNQTLLVGATLSVDTGAIQTAGAYTDTFTVTVNYN